MEGIPCKLTSKFVCLFIYAAVNRIGFDLLSRTATSSETSERREASEKLKTETFHNSFAGFNARFVDRAFFVIFKFVYV